MVSKRENEVKEKIQQPGEEKKEKDLIAPLILKVSLNAMGFEQWLAQHLQSFQLRLKQELSIIKSSQLETILNYALQFRLQTKSNKFCRKWRQDYQSFSCIWE